MTVRRILIELKRRYAALPVGWGRSELCRMIRFIENDISPRHEYFHQRHLKKYVRKT